MKLTKTEVEHLAKLARLELSPNEIQNYQEDLGNILDYVAKLNELSATKSPLSGVSPKVKLRPDIIKVWPEPKNLIEMAPEKQDSLISVPPVFE